MLHGFSAERWIARTYPGQFSDSWAQWSRMLVDFRTRRDLRRRTLAQRYYCVRFGPEDHVILESGEVYSQADLAEALQDSTTAQPAVPHVIPSSSVPRELRSLAGNRALLPGRAVDSGEVRTMLSSQPLDLTAEQFNAMCESHLIDTTLAKLDRELVPEFVEGRQSKIQEEVRSYEKLCQWDFENTPPLSTFDMDAEDDESA